MDNQTPKHARPPEQCDKYDSWIMLHSLQQILQVLFEKQTYPFATAKKTRKSARNTKSNFIFAPTRLASLVVPHRPHQVKWLKCLRNTSSICLVCSRQRNIFSVGVTAPTKHSWHGWKTWVAACISCWMWLLFQPVSASGDHLLT